jgi:CubicO group peptidase (beta-lactamase class C family)
MVEESVLQPLGMDSSYSGDVPQSEWSRSVIVDPLEYSLPVALSVGSGGLASTINDLAKFGAAVLNSTLIPDEETRRWLKPISHTGRFEFSFGRPWYVPFPAA